MSEGKSSSGCLKIGFLGCLGVVGLVFLVGMVIGGLQFAASRRPVNNVSESKSRALPIHVLQDSSLLATAAQLEDAATVTPIDTERIDQRSVDSPGVGTLRLDLAIGEFTIVPGEPGSSIEVEAHYDKSRFRLVEDYSEGPEGTWSYLIRLEPARRFLGFSRSADSRVEIRLPPGHPMDIVGDLRMGTSDMELGGLSVRSVHLDMSMGDHRISISEPTAEPMESFQIKGSMGSIRVAGLGNASPRRVEGRHQMGEMRLDLTGAWISDSDVSLRCRMGECRVEVPKDVRVIAKRASVIMGGKSIRLPDTSALPEDVPTLTLDLRASMGEIRVR